MRAQDLTHLTFNAIASHRLRSLLTVLGIAVGIAAVVLMTALGEGVRQFVMNEFTQFGTNIIAITPGKTSTFGVSGATVSSVRPLTTDDAVALLRANSVEAVVPVVQGNARVEFGRKHRRTTVIGVGSDMPAVWQMGVDKGSFLPNDPFESSRSYAVLGSRMHSELFGDAGPISARIRIGGDRFRVIGVMESKGQMLGFDLDDTVFIPAGKATELFDREGVMGIDVIYTDQESADTVAEALKKVLLARHGQEDFTIKTQEQMLSVLDSVLQLLTLGVAAIGGISLVVGAVGITTIMTIAVTERTAEIGLLCAIGAPRSQIGVLFLVESAILGACGGVMGVGVAIALVFMLQWFVPTFPVALVWVYVAGACGMASVIGILAGLTPALKAAKMNPVDALRAN